LEASFEKTKQWVKSIRDFRDTEKYLSESSQQADDHLSKLKALLFEMQGFQNEGSRCCAQDELSRACLMSKKLRVPPATENYFSQKYSTQSSWFSIRL
jgi:hypothetical protein